MPQKKKYIVRGKRFDNSNLAGVLLESITITFFAESDEEAWKNVINMGVSVGLVDAELYCELSKPETGTKPNPRW